MGKINSVFILATFTLKLFSQVDSLQQVNSLPIDKETGLITFSEVIKIDSVNSQELYLRAKEWFVNSFTSAQNVIQLDDKESGLLIGKGLFDVKTTIRPNVDFGHIDFTVKIQVKDGRYKYTFTDFWHDAGGSGATTPGDLRLEKPGGGILTMGMKNWEGVKKQTSETTMYLIEGLKKAMNKKNNSDNW